VKSIKEKIFTEKEEIRQSQQVGNCFAALTGGSGYAKHQSGLRPLWVFLRHIFLRPSKCSAFFLIGRKK
jgi:hypothetical protein